ncbi:MAG: PIG-L family deacetylase [Bacteroidota bacterium]
MNHQFRYLLRLILLSLLLFGVSRADELQETNGAHVRRDLGNNYVLLCLSAHPDDEDGATLAYYRMKFGVKPFSVFFTRGEGGQNEKGPELYEELGAIRTEETERAGRILMSDVSFLNFYDFGYSKTAMETFQLWGGKGEVLRRLVYVIRRGLFTEHAFGLGVQYRW